MGTQPLVFRSISFDVEMAKLELDGMEMIIEEDLMAEMKVWENEDELEKPKIEKTTNRNNSYFLWIVLIGIISIVLLIWIFYPVEKNVPTEIQNETIPKKENKKVTPVNPVESYDPVEEEKNVQKDVPKGTRKQDLDIAASETNSQPNYLAMAETAYELPDFGTRLKSNSGTDTSQIARATDAIQQKDFKETIRILQKYTGKNQTDANDLLGHAYFNEKEFKNAANAFRKNQNSFRKKYESEWFLFLSLLAEKGIEDEEVEALSNKLSDQGHPFHIMYKKVIH